MSSDSEQYPDSQPAASAGAARAQAKFTERRANRRYELVVEFDLFHLWGVNHLIWSGTGHTRNWSRNSILIDWDKPLAAGSSVELVVRWSGNVQLVVIGRVLNSEARGTVIRILRRRFRGKSELAEITRAAGPAPAAKPGHERAS